MPVLEYMLLALVGLAGAAGPGTPTRTFTADAATRRSGGTEVLLGQATGGTTGKPASTGRKRRRRHRKGLRHGRPRKNVYVIGEQLAKAHAAEQQRLKGNVGPSPMPVGKYDFWRGEQSLTNPVKNLLDSRLSDLCQNYRDSDVKTRAGIRAAIGLDEFYTLLTFSSRAAVFALRERSVNWIINGLTAIAMIESQRIDSRDALLA
jgi:hypothetical protein